MLRPTLQPLKAFTILSMATKLPTIKSHDTLITWSCEIRWQTKNIFTTRMSMDTKLGCMVTYFKDLLPIKLLNSLVTWSGEILWQTKTILRRTVIFHGNSHPKSHVTVRSCGLAISQWLLPPSFVGWCFTLMSYSVLPHALTIKSYNS